MYRDPDLNVLTEVIWDFWKSQTDDPRWSEMEYLIEDGKITLSYVYPDEIDPEESSFDRRRRIVEKHFGERPILYPPWDEDDDGPIYDL